MSVQCSPLTDLVIGGHEGLSSRDSLPVFSAGGHHKQFWHGRDVHTLTLSIQHWSFLFSCFCFFFFFFSSVVRLIDFVRIYFPVFIC